MPEARYPAGLLLSGLPGRDHNETKAVTSRENGKLGGQAKRQQDNKKGKVMIYKRGDWYWTDFTENGRRYRRPLKTKELAESSH